MLLQLGNKIFDGIFAPSALSYSGSEANLAQYDLINTKPRLQFTGETLEEVSLQFNLRAEFCNPAQEIKDFEAWKSAGEILPLLMGNGEYVNDYVIKSISKGITRVFADGTIIEASVTVELLEYVPGSEEEIQAANDRRKALAVGDKKQVIRRPVQKATSEYEAHKALMDAQNKSWEAAEEAEKAKNLTTPEEKIPAIKTKLERAQDAMSIARDSIELLQGTIQQAEDIYSGIEQVKGKLSTIGNLLTTPISLGAFNDSILNLQVGLQMLNDQSKLFTNDIILRKI